MNKFLALFVLLAVTYTLGAPTEVGRLPALRHEEVHDDLGQYALRYYTAEGTYVAERGHLVSNAAGGRVMVYEGEFSYIGADGKTYVTRYTADLDGFRIHEPVLVTVA